MRTTGRLPKKINFGSFSDSIVINPESGLTIASAPVYTLPQYVIPGNIMVLPLGPTGLWNVGEKELVIQSSGGVYSIPNWATWAFQVRLSPAPAMGPISYMPSGDGGGVMSFGAWPSSDYPGHTYYLQQIDITIDGRGNMTLHWYQNAGIVTDFDQTFTGRKSPIELFIPLTQKIVVPYIDPGLTIVDTATATKLLMDQGASRQSVVSTPLHPSPYIPFGSLMGIILDKPHGLWKISYNVGGYLNSGQLEIAQVGDKLVGRMNMSGSMMYGASGWETISGIVFGDGMFTKSLSFIRDYTRQRWDGVIKGDTFSGTFGGGPAAGGGMFTALKDPMEFYIPTDITQYTQAMVITKEMPLATLVPTATVSGKPTGTVVVEQGFAPTQAQVEQVISSQPVMQQGAPIQGTEVAPITNVSAPKSAIGEAISTIPSSIPWIWIIVGVGAILVLGKGKKSSSQAQEG